METDMVHGGFRHGEAGLWQRGRQVLVGEWVGMPMLGSHKAAQTYTVAMSEGGWLHVVDGRLMRWTTDPGAGPRLYASGSQIVDGVREGYVTGEDPQENARTCTACRQVRGGQPVSEPTGGVL